MYVPAHKKLSCKTKCFPRRVFRSFCAHASCGTMGNSTRFKITCKPHTDRIPISCIRTRTHRCQTVKLPDIFPLCRTNLCPIRMQSIGHHRTGHHDSANKRYSHFRQYQRDCRGTIERHRWTIHPCNSPGEWHNRALADLDAGKSHLNSTKNTEKLTKIH